MPITLNDEKLTGLILASMSNIIPEGFLLCDGSAINRTTYSSLFALSPSTTSTVTMTIASPCVVTWSSHGLATGQSIQFSTTGTLPTGVVAGTVYFIRLVDTSSFHLYDTQANAMNTGTTTGRVNTSGSQSGTHTAFVYFWGNGNGITTFNIPDGRGGVLRGAGVSVGYTQNVTVTLGSKDNDASQDHKHNDSGHNHSVYYWVHANGGSNVWGLSNAGPVASQEVSQWIYNGTSYANITEPIINSAGTPRTATETKMKNIGVNFFIKY